MPYITQTQKDNLYSAFATTPGELNYLITDTIKTYLKTNELSYKTINDIVGALEGAKMEFYRRVAVPYENQKCHDNGDVYE